MAIYEDIENDAGETVMDLKNHIIYGSSRIGIANKNESTHASCTGGRNYELTNYLGNVMAVISDNFTDDGEDVLTLSAYDYYPFGMQSRSEIRTGENPYKFGFNGMEKEDAAIYGTGSLYTTPFRQYDPRIGRWLTTDPVVHPWQSPYAAFNDNPVYFKDPSGLDGDGANGGKKHGGFLRRHGVWGKFKKAFKSVGNFVKKLFGKRDIPMIQGPEFPPGTTIDEGTVIMEEVIVKPKKKHKNHDFHGLFWTFM